MQDELVRIRDELEKNSLTVDHEMSNDLMTVMDQNQEKMTPFMKLFWQEQKKLRKSSQKGVRYHPMIFRFCLSLQSKSSSGYDERREALGKGEGRIMTLPSQRRLRDYKNWARSKRCFHYEIICELIGLTDKYFGVQRHIMLLFDEMKIQSDLVFDKVTGELIGFIDLGDPDTNYATSHALVFFVRGMATDLNFNLFYFGTTGVTSSQLMSLSLEAIGILEML